MGCKGNKYRPLRHGLGGHGITLQLVPNKKKVEGVVDSPPRYPANGCMLGPLSMCMSKCILAVTAETSRNVSVCSGSESPRSKGKLEATMHVLQFMYEAVRMEHG